MYKKIIILCIGLFISINVYSDSEINTKIIKVHDGDSVKFLYNNEVYTGRLKGIDAPELKQPYGIEARDYLRQLVLNKKVDIVIDDKVDIYNRYLVTIYSGLENVNRLMVENGFAWNYMDNGIYKIYKDIAEKNKIGLWSDDKNNIISPSSFRKMKNSKNNIQLLDHPNPYCKTAEFKTCGNFTNCFEAMFWMNICGHTYLDRNDNGIPCETICK